MLDLMTLRLGSSFSLMAIAASSAIALDEWRDRADMFDLDQKRHALPNDGRMYCVPVSFMDKLAYLRKYGMTGMTGGYNPSSHTEMSSLAFLLGVLMGTDPEDGTSGSMPVEINWINNKTNKLVVFLAYGPSTNWSYRTVMNKFRAGGLVRMAYGRYKNIGSSWSRKSGHSVGIAGYYRYDTGNSGSFFVADPATDDGDWSQQGPFIFQIKETNDITLTTEDHGVVTHARYTNWVGGTANYPGSWRAVVDSMLVTLPVFAGWTTPTLDGNHFDIKFQFQMNPPTFEAFPTSYRLTVAEGIRDWCFDMMNFGLCWVNSSGDVKLRSVSVDDTQTLFSSAAARLVTIGGPDQDVYVVREGTFRDAVTKYSRKSGRTSSITLFGKAGAFDVDESTGELVVVDSNLDEVTVFDPDFTRGVRQPLFGIVPVRPGVTIQTGGAMMSIDSESGDYLVAVPGEQQWTRYYRQGSVRIGRTVPVSLRGGIQRIAAGPQDTVFVQATDDRVFTYHLDGREKVTEFSGLQATGPLRLAKSINAYRPGEMQGPSWVDVLPDDENP
jgi:hypothetical protein